MGIMADDAADLDDIYYAIKANEVSLRDRFAGQLMAAIIGAPDAKIDIKHDVVGIDRARFAYVLADAMMKARNE